MDVVEKAFSKAGYDIVYPEELDFDSMVQTLQEARFFAAPEGSCAHNSVFLPRQANIMIIKKADYTNWHQIMINYIRSLNVTYVYSYFHAHYLLYEPNRAAGGPFFVYVNKQLANALNVSPCYNYIGFCRYITTTLLRKSYVAAISIASSIKHVLTD